MKDVLVARKLMSADIILLAGFVVEIITNEFAVKGAVVAVATVAEAD